jgi:hypothetical protein
MKYRIILGVVSCEAIHCEACDDIKLPQKHFDVVQYTQTHISHTCEMLLPNKGKIYTYTRVARRWTTRQASTYREKHRIDHDKRQLSHTKQLAIQPK